MFVGQERGKNEAAIFDAHIALLHDPSLRETVSALCSTSRLNVEAALSKAIDTLTAAFARLANPYFRERAADLLDGGTAEEEPVLLAHGGQMVNPGHLLFN